MTATFPDGRRQDLLNVPDYDFNWQLFYYPKTRISLPRGTRVDVVAHYDNSAANRSNPDPGRAVSFGETSADEMMFGTFEFIADTGVSPKPADDRMRMEVLLSSLPAEIGVPRLGAVWLRADGVRVSTCLAKARAPGTSP